MSIIEKYDYSDISSTGKNTVVIGESRAVKRKIFAGILRNWKKENGPLVVFDNDNLYQDFGAGCTMCDFTSANSVMPDFIYPILVNPAHGASPTEAGKFLASELLLPALRSRNNNDQFFDLNARMAGKQFYKYMTIIAEISKENKKYNWMMAFALQAEKLWKIAREVSLNNISSSLEDYEGIVLMQYLQDEEDEMPFESTLKGPNSNYSSTSLSILRSLNAIHVHMDNFYDMLNRKCHFLKTLPEFDIFGFINGSQPPLFISGSENKNCALAIAMCALAAFQAVAEIEGKNVTVVIPEFDKWGLGNVLFEKLAKQESSSPGLRFITGWSLLSSVVRQCPAERPSYVVQELLSTADYTIWTSSSDSAITQTYKDRTPIAVRRYDLDLLFSDYAAVQNNNVPEEIRYFPIKEPNPAQGILEKAEQSDEKTKNDIWINRVER